MKSNCLLLSFLALGVISGTTPAAAQTKAPMASHGRCRTRHPAIAVTPDRSDVYVAVPRISSVAVVNVNTNMLRLRLPVGAQPTALAIAPSPGAILVPYVIKAVPDAAPLSVPSTGGVAVANVL